MTGLKAVVPSVVADPLGRFPTLRDDARLSAGSLTLLDFAHSANPYTGGVPAAGASLDVPNIAWKEAAALLGTSSPDKSSIPGRITVGANMRNGVKGNVEMTSKGGLHVILSQSVDLAANEGVAVGWDAAVRSFILANPTHAFYVSAWMKNTRLQLGTTSNPIAKIDTSTGATASSIGNLVANQANAFLGPVTNSRGVGVNELGLAYASWRSTVGSGANAVLGLGAYFGARGNLNASAWLANGNKRWPSWAIYSLYLEDLTVSGRSYATVDAIDYAEFQRAFATGGRYAGDTHTNPSTVA